MATAGALTQVLVTQVVLQLHQHPLPNVYPHDEGSYLKITKASNLASSSVSNSVMSSTMSPSASATAKSGAGGMVTPEWAIAAAMVVGGAALV